MNFSRFRNVFPPFSFLSCSKSGISSLRNNLNRPFFHSAKCYQKSNGANGSRSYRMRSTVYYATTLTIVTAGLTYAAVPLYRIFCQTSGYGGTTQHVEDDSRVEGMKKVKNRLIKVRFNSDVSSSLAWDFMPQQTEIKVVPGETALAFYTATNPTDKAIIGVSTYNVIPFEVGPYFNKIQCFCFEEQQLNPHEQVDMPVFFYIDPEFAEDPKMELIDEITLSYTFFEAREGMKLPIPSYIRKQINR